jgi:hypothetical protein
MEVMMFNLPPSIFNFQSMMNRQPQWSKVNPFRTVESPAAYGDGLNSSASQMYQYILRHKGHPYLLENGWQPAHKIQSMDDFLNRRNPTPAQPPQINVQPPKAPGNIPGMLPMNPGQFDPSIFNAPQAMPTPFPAGQPGVPPTDSPSVRSTGMPQITGQMPSMGAGIFNMPQFNRR